MADHLDPKQNLTGLVLAGGQGRRMGQEKGLAAWHGRPLAQQALERLRPQVQTVALNVNRRFDAYSQWGVPLWHDAQPETCIGPLAGVLAGLKNMQTDWLLTVPCDAPRFPADLAARLCQALSTQPALAAFACCPSSDPSQTAPKAHPVFALIHRDLAPGLVAFLAQNERKVGFWLTQQGALPVLFDDPQAFANFNTPTDLQN